MTTEPGKETKIQVLPVPLLLRMISILMIVGAVIAILFYLAVGLFQFNDSSFIGNAGLSGLGSNFYSFYIVLHIVLYASFVVCGIYLMRLRKTGFYLFIINYLILTAFAVYLNDVISWSTIAVGLVLLAVLSYYVKKMH